ncbi:hypothetical protein BDFG_06146 [Blastomyces dermatitidis ATCC 26199]|nr:hypothetical protein BDFG_06146 [Blastomyces dermatitidis ATCC 26199]
MYSELRVEHIFVQTRTNESTTIPDAYPSHEYFRLFRIAREELEDKWLLEEWSKIPFPEHGDNRAKRTREHVFSKHLGTSYNRAPSGDEDGFSIAGVSLTPLLGVLAVMRLTRLLMRKIPWIITIHWLAAKAVGAPRSNVMNQQSDGSDSCPSDASLPSGQRPAYPEIFEFTSSPRLLFYLHPMTSNPCDTKTYEAFYNEGISRDEDTRMGSDYDGDCDDSETEKGTRLDNVKKQDVKNLSGGS